MKKEKTSDNSNTTINSRQLAILTANFPQCFDKNGDFIPHKMQEVVSKEGVNLSKESYSLNWLGKSYARLLANETPLTLLKEDAEHNQKPENENSENLLIKGDNLEVLKHLRHAYSESVKMIYIDPPYNTGNDGFVYADNRKFTTEQLSQLAGIDEDEAQRILEFTNSKSNSHSAWLTFIYPRLYIARELLSNDGVIFVSIDDNEQAQLKMLCDEVFGESNFVGQISVENNPKGRKNSDYISISNDCLLIYVKQVGESYFIENIPKNIKDLSFDEETGKYIHGSGKRVLVGENSFNKEVSNLNSDKHYSVYYNSSKNDLKIIKENNINADNSELIKNRYVRFISIRGQAFIENTYTSDKLKELFQQKALELKNGKIFEKNCNTSVRIKSILTSQKYTAYFNNSVNEFVLDLKTTSAGTYIKDLFETKDAVFPMSKNVGLIKILLSLLKEKNFIILDFFAGSGTTGDAVMQLNAEDGGQRKCISVQLDESINEKKNKIAYDFVKDELEQDNPTIFDITKERILRAGAKIQKDNQASKEPKDLSKQDFGFKVFEILPMFEGFFGEMDELDEQQTLFDGSKLSDDDLQTLLTSWMANDGVKLTAKVEKVVLDKYTACYVDKNLYLMDKGFTTDDLKFLLEKLDSVDGDNKNFQPTKLVLFGYNFKSKHQREISEALNNYTNKKQIELDRIIRY